MVVQPVLYDHDLQQTLENRTRLRDNPNLLYWYAQLYGEIFGSVEDVAGRSILEIGSGTSPLKLFFPQVSTSDVLNLDYLDHVFDCQEIDRYDAIADHSLDVITMTNVLHHVKDPLTFLKKATSKLRPRGEIIMVEPYFSALSFPIYKLLHHEPVDFSIARPVLASIAGPLSSSNQAIPYMLFVSRPDWLSELSSDYDTRNIRISYFSSLSYMASGGISRSSLLPSSIYRAVFPIDRVLARAAPRLFASFFVVRLKSKASA
jgi:SAM-dependent methyltransferase